MNFDILSFHHIISMMSKINFGATSFSTCQGKKKLSRTGLGSHARTKKPRTIVAEQPVRKGDKYGSGIRLNLFQFLKIRLNLF